MGVKGEARARQVAKTGPSWKQTALRALAEAAAAEQQHVVLHSKTAGQCWGLEALHAIGRLQSRLQQLNKDGQLGM